MGAMTLADKIKVPEGESGPSFRCADAWTCEARWMKTGLRRVGGAAAAVLAVAVALASLRYLASPAPHVPPNVARNALARPWLPIHAVLAAMALLLGVLQFLRTRGGARRWWHRWSGRGYMLACLGAAPAGLILAFGATTGPVATAGFGSLAVVWFTCTVLGWMAARRRDFTAHRAWMIRGYALTFAAVTLRLYLPVVLLAHLDFVISYRAISFLCWVPNLVLAEVYVRRGVAVDWG